MATVSTAPLVGTGGLADLVGRAIDVPPVLGQPTSPFRQLSAAWIERFSGLLSLRIVDASGNEELIALSLREGRVELCGSDRVPNEEELLRYLHEEHVLRFDEIDDAVEKADTTHCDLARALYDLQLLDAKGVVAALRMAMERRLLRAMKAVDGHITVVPAGVLGHLSKGTSPVDLGPPLYDHMRWVLRTVYEDVLGPALAPLAGSYLSVTEAGRETMRRLGFGTRDVLVAERLLDGSRRLDGISRVTMLSQSASLRLLLELALLGLLVCTDEQLASDGTVRAATEAERVAEWRGELVRQDHFARLRTHWANHPREIEGRWEALQRDLARRERLHPELRSAYAEIRELLEEAWLTVESRESRRLYRKKLAEGQQIEYSADLAFNQGRTSEICGELEDAIRFFELSDELCATEPNRAALTRVREKRRSMGFA